MSLLNGIIMLAELYASLLAAGLARLRSRTRVDRRRRTMRLVSPKEEA